MTVCLLASLFLQLRVPPQYLNIFYQIYMYIKKVWNHYKAFKKDSAKVGSKGLLQMTQREGSWTAVLVVTCRQCWGLARPGCRTQSPRRGAGRRCCWLGSWRRRRSRSPRCLSQNCSWWLAGISSKVSSVGQFWYWILHFLQGSEKVTMISTRNI